MAALRFDVFGRQLAVEKRSDAHWRAYWPSGTASACRRIS